MSDQRERWKRREFVSWLTLGMAGLLSAQPESLAAEPPPETTKIKLPRYRVDVMCFAPEWVAEELLHAEGFTRVDYVTVPATPPALSAGDLDLAIQDAPALILRLDAGDPLVIVSGLHGGCFELFAVARVRSVRDLKGATVAAVSPGRRAFVASMASYVGLDPQKDITWVSPPPAEAMQLLAEEKIDAYLGFPPEPQELRARKIGHVIVNTRLDRPWSQYFCCMIAANREFVRKHPVATKRAVRAILKAADICATEPERVARLLTERGYVKRPEHVLQALREIPYDRWRSYDAPDTIRFFALRMHEAAVIKTSPQKIIAQGTDWRILEELKKELKR